jgi:hypothetical protein
MGSVQYVIIMFKLGNESIAPPNETSATPSQAPIMMQYSRVLLDNETWEFPFQWSIIKVNRVQNAASLILNLNGTVVDMPAPINQGGKNFRIIIELWVYNPDTDAFNFGWVTGTEKHVSWLQIWFNATLPVS